ncbi:NAD(P)/FAD-dependent oxidoreductase [Oceanimonas baumannii]|uniref:Amine oxidase n=1 Tax=Oceanimonas baumannii TaxID=129578 RepID=A0A235CE04_9GAMM|nr:FAD-binding oxidoreductase [Oceanimonas baumannii]OYD22676.1 amine oxidase [Oceanimonas baumannii]TDW57562.1 glycine/D-amino acid oxidase-like deaminating enzyme [Oceanimonas baumannii]
MKLALTPPLKHSYWLEQAEPTALNPAALQGHHQVDVAIIGGGFVGLWTALTLKQHEPDIRVMILEQDICGGGASGRNGGMAMSWWPKIGTLSSFCSQEQALFLGHSAEQAISDLGEFCRQHNIDAHFQQRGWLWTATTPAHVDSWNTTLKACERLGVMPFERVSKAEIARLTGSDVHLAGVLERSNATIQPAALARGLRRVAEQVGVEIMEHSGVTELQPGQPVILKTTQGQVLANSVVLATNAWAACLPELARLIVPVNSSIVVTEPIPDRLQQLGWTGNEAITDSQLMVDYYRTTTDGRIAFGKGTGALSYGSQIGPLFSEDNKGIAMTEADFRRTYSTLEDVEFSHSWSGPIDRTYDSLPVFGQLQDQPNIHYGIGWSGNGVSPSRIGGRILASLALGRQDQWSQCALVNRTCKPFPPEPFRYLGGTLVRNAVIRKEREELAGRPGRALDRMLASLAPSGLEDKS